MLIVQSLFVRINELVDWLIDWLIDSFLNMIWLNDEMMLWDDGMMTYDGMEWNAIKQEVIVS